MANADRIIDIFYEAKVTAAGPERDGFLKRACGEDIGLKEQIVSLLAADDDEAAASFLKGAAIVRRDIDDRERAGDWIGRYKLIETIGEGGCGVVYLAEQEKPVRLRVALKVIKLGMDTRQVVARFQAEWQALALMEHPNIAKVFDAGATATGRPYFVMELVDGIRITDHCDLYNLSLRDRLELFVQVCRTIQHAHQKGVIHRDIKPSNVLVILQDDVRAPKVIDFGIAKATEQRLTDGTIFTCFEQFIGTPAYMSPEQAERKGGDIDTRADIYSLGVLLYELLAGRTPFEAKRFVGLDIEETRRIIRETDPARPSAMLGGLEAGDLEVTAARRATDPLRLVHNVRGDLDWIVMKCLEKDSARRYASANDLASDVERHLHNEPVTARPPGTAYRLQKAWRRNKLAVTATLVVAGITLLAIAELGISTLRITNEQRRTQSALLAVTAAKSELEQTLQRERVEAYFHRIAFAHRELSADNLSGFLKSLEECPKDLRGWEWNYLNRVARVGPFVLEDTDELYSVAFHPGGGLLAAAGKEGVIKIWDLTSGKVIQKLVGHTSYVFSIAFRPPHGRYLASAGADRKVRVWDRSTGRELFQCPGPAGEPTGMSYAVGFSPDGRELVADDGEGTLTSWNADDGKEMGRFPGKHELAATCVSYSHDGKFLASGSWSGVLRIWNAPTHELLQNRLEHSHRISGVAFRHDGQSIATSSFDRTLKIWEPATGKLSRSWQGHFGMIPGLAFHPDGLRIASCGAEDKSVKLWDPLTGREILNLRGHTATCYCVAFSPDGDRLASAGQDGMIRIWDARPLEPNEALELLTCNHESEVWSVAFSPNGKIVASGGWDETVRLWDAQTGASIRILRHPGSVFHVAFSPDGRQLAVATLTATRSAAVVVWDTVTGQQLFTLTEKAFPFCVIFDPTGRYLFREGAGFRVKVWDTQTRAEVGMLGQHNFNIWGMVFSPDERHLATASSDGFVKVWRWDAARIGEPQEPQIVIRSSVMGYGERAAFTPDGSRIVTSAKGNIIRISDANTGDELNNLPGHTGEIWAIALDRQGRWLATAGEDTTIRIWAAESGKPLRTLRGHTGVIMSLNFSPEGDYLVSGSRDHTVKIWETARWKDSEGR